MAMTIQLLFLLVGLLGSTNALLDDALGITSCQTSDIDLVFLVDASNSISPPDFHLTLETIVTIVSFFNTDDGHLRTAVVTFGDTPSIDIALGNGMNELELSESIQTISRGFGSRTNTGDAIALAIDQVYQVEYGHRPSAHKFMIIFTDGQSQQPDNTVLQSSRAKSEGVVILVFGIGQMVSEEELFALGSDPEAVVFIANFFRLKAAAATALRLVCPVCDTGDGWFAYNGMCYLIERSEDKISWLDANRRCMQIKSTMVEIYGPDQENELVANMQGGLTETYIGLSKEYKQTTVNVDNFVRWRGGLPLVYTNWKKGNPNGASLERCVIWGSDGWEDIFCGERISNQYICMKHSLEYEFRNEITPVLPNISGTFNTELLEVRCPNGELVSKFDTTTLCEPAGCDDGFCGRDLPISLTCDDTTHQCANGGCVSLTFLCDGTADCADSSDEDGCVMGACTDGQWRCDNGQCIDEALRCDFDHDCLDSTDEVNCAICRGYECFDGKCIPQAWVGDGAVDCDGFNNEDEMETSFNKSVATPRTHCIYMPDMNGKVALTFPDDDMHCSLQVCPPGFFKCPASYCIPVSLVCNGLQDCPDGQDEDNCYKFTCPGYYRCRGQKYCIHPDQVCDRVRNCPDGDDERYCNTECPSACECQGRVVKCSKNFNISDPIVIPRDVRKLDLTGFKGQFPSLNDLHYLAFLIMARCSISDLTDIPEYPNLIELDLSDNNLQRLYETMFKGLKHLKYLDLSNNIQLESIDNGTFMHLTNLINLNLKNTGLKIIRETYFYGATGLLSLNLSSAQIVEIEDYSLSSMSSLTSLDIRSNDIVRFGVDVFSGLDSLDKLHTDSFKFCCDSLRPPSLTAQDCQSSATLIASCKDLLGNDILRIMLWFIAIFSTIGNILLLGFRLKYDRRSLKRSYGIFVTNLSISDCLMGVYMIIIGAADSNYRGSYIWNDHAWKHGSVCKFAGFISTVSSEASCIFITLITLDRFLAIKYPFGQFRLNRKSVLTSVVCTWVLAFLLAGIPLLSPFSHWNFYGKNSVCLALPLSNDRGPGWEYASALYIGFNFILFLLVGVGQTLIYESVKSSSKIRVGGSADAKVARKLFLVVFTDFLCWFPVGIMGIMAIQGFQIDRNVYAWIAVTVLPLNSALNPFLYTLPSIIQTHREMRKRKMSSTMSSSLTANRTMNVNIYVGNPRKDMECLSSLFEADDMSRELKWDVIDNVVAFVLDLQQRNRRYQPLKREDIFIQRDGEEVSEICLSLTPDPDRKCVTDDVMYLMQLLKHHVTMSKEVEITDVCTRI